MSNVSNEEQVKYALSATDDAEHKQSMLDYLDELKARINNGEIEGYAVFGVHTDGRYFGGTAFRGGISMKEIRTSARELFYYIDQAQAQEDALRAEASEH